MRILVLGGTGAMGVPLVKLLSNRGDEVFVTSRKIHDSKDNIHFIQGNAHNLSFIKQELNKNYDAIVDFMIYNTEDFHERSELYLKSTGQYVFLSSARVYADSKKPITENSPRLLDICKDTDYLKTDEYALAKARSENVLFESHSKNWTIVRPYITYNTRRLQLGGLELESWLTAVLSGRPLVLPKDVGMCQTTMTYGDDVARGITTLIGNNKALSETFHLTGTDHIKWIEVAKIYKNVLEEKTGQYIEIYEPETSNKLSEIMENNFQIKYDRKYNRVFDNSKFLSVCDKEFDFVHIKDGIRNCLKEYLQFYNASQQLNKPNLKLYAWLDKITDRKNSIQDIDSKKKQMIYLGYYYAPKIMNILKKIINKK